MYHLLGTLIILLSVKTESQVMLTQSGEVFVCPGGQLSFRCSTNLRFLEWNVTISRSDSRRQLVTPLTEFELDLIIRGQFFNITRISAYDSLPLISTLTVATAVADLNATKIKCTEIKTSDDKNSSVATINIINTYPDPPVMRAPKPLEFRTNSILVLIDWNQSRHHENDTAYYVDAIPQALVIFTSSTSAQLQVLYNVVYNVSVTATLCGQRSATTTVFSYSSSDESLAVVSSITVFIFASLLFFIIGFLSGYFTLRFRYKRANLTFHIPHNHPIVSDPATTGAPDQIHHKAVPELERHQQIESQKLEAEIRNGNKLEKEDSAQLKDQQELEVFINCSIKQEEYADQEFEMIRANILDTPVQTN